MKPLAYAAAIMTAFGLLAAMNTARANPPATGPESQAHPDQVDRFMATTSVTTEPNKHYAVTWVILPPSTDVPDFDVTVTGPVNSRTSTVGTGTYWFWIGNTKVLQYEVQLNAPQVGTYNIEISSQAKGLELKNIKVEELKPPKHK
jgi:hypothetical protein